MGQLEDVSSWRLATPDGVPYRVKGMTGDVSQEDSSVNLVIIIQASQLYELAFELFPPPVLTSSGPVYGIPVQLGGFVNIFGTRFQVPLYAKKLTWKGFVDGLPVDPFSSDLLAPGPTYYKFLEATLSFQPLKITQSNQDPKDLIEISGKGSSEYKSAAMPLAKTVAGLKLIDPKKFTRIMINKESWDLKFPLVAAEFAQSFIGTLRGLCGHVNAAAFSFLGTAPAETLKLEGWTYEEKWTWSHSQLQSPPVQLTLHIEEQAVPATDAIGGGSVGGWNHEYIEKDSTGAVVGQWKRLFIDGVSQTKYPSGDFSQLIPF